MQVFEQSTYAGAQLYVGLMTTVDFYHLIYTHFNILASVLAILVEGPLKTYGTAPAYALEIYVGIYIAVFGQFARYYTITRVDKVHLGIERVVEVESVNHIL